MAEPGSPAEVSIVGGGVAAFETLLALRDLAGDRVGMQLVAPEPDFVCRYEREPRVESDPAPDGVADLDASLDADVVVPLGH